MSRSIRVYVAGKVSPGSSFGKEHWRDEFCFELSRLANLPIRNLDPIQASPDFDLDENRPDMTFGRDCFLIRESDAVIVYLSDDISVGGSQEMLLAKYFSKPLIGIAKNGGKFRGEKVFRGKTYQNWIHPFVHVPCDVVVEDIQEAAHALRTFVLEQKPVKNLGIIEESIQAYLMNDYPKDTLLHDLETP